MLNRKKLWRSIREILATAVIVTTVSLFVISFVMAPVWHVFNGDLVTKEGWRVLMPRTYSPNQGSYFRFGFGPPFFRKHDFGHIAMNMHPKRAGVTPELIEEAVTNSAAVEGFHFVRRKTVQSFDTTNYCFEFTNNFSSYEESIRCVNDSGEVYLFFWGNPRYKGDLYRVVATLQKSK